MPALENIQLGCAFCRICCYTIWRKICCKKPKPPRPDFSVICLGLTEAGKSTLLSLLCGEDLSNIDGPTTGFSIKAVQLDDCILNIKEIGGGEKVRPFWKHYFSASQGVIFVVNSSASEEELERARDALYESLHHPALRGLPCLILANYQDVAGARNKDKISEVLELSDACSGRDWVLITCSMNNIKQLKQDFSKFTKFFTQTSEDVQGEEGPQKSSSSSQGPTNRI